MGEMERNREHQRKNVTIPEECSQLETLSGEETIECECRKNGTNTEHINICGRHEVISQVRNSSHRDQQLIKGWGYHV